MGGVVTCLTVASCHALAMCRWDLRGEGTRDVRAVRDRVTWAALDDKFHGHRKLALLGPLRLPCAGLHAIAISWCADHLSDGLVPLAVAEQLAGNFGVDVGGAGLFPESDFSVTRGVKFLIDELVRVKLWDDNGNGTYSLHGYLEYNPSRREVMQRRKNKQKAGRIGGQASAQARAQASALAELQQVLDLCLRSGSSRIQHPSPPLPSPFVRKNVNVNVAAHAANSDSAQDQAAVALLADDILAVTRDPHSRPFYEQLAAALPRDMILAALSETRQAVAGKRVRKTPARLFTFLIRQAINGSGAAKGRDSPRSER